MNTCRLYFILLLSVLPAVITAGCSSEQSHHEAESRREHSASERDLKSNAALEDKMDALYRDYRKLQRYAFNENLFSKQESQDDVTRLLDRMLRHTPDASQYSKDKIGFQTSLEIFKDNIRDVSQRLREGNSDYAYWQLGSVFNQCVSCHMMYGDKQVEAKRIAPASQGMNALDRARYYIAAHSFKKAEQELEDLIQGESDSSLVYSAYQQLLVIVTRLYSAEEAAAKLESLNLATTFDAVQQSALQDWIAYLRSQSTTSLEGLAAVRQHMKEAESLGEEQELHKETVAYMMSVWALHEMLQQWDFIGQPRSEALLLLGTAYKNLPFYFDQSLAEQFLEQCIRDYPGTSEARKAYTLLEESIVLRFTGSAGVTLPADVRKRLNLLAARARQS